MPVTRSTEIRDTTLNPTVTTDRGCTTGHNHTLSLSLPWAGTWHLQCSKLGVSTQSKGQISHLRARNVHRHECVTLAEFTEAPLLHVWRQEQPSTEVFPHTACFRWAGIDQVLIGACLRSLYPAPATSISSSRSARDDKSENKSCTLLGSKEGQGFSQRKTWTILGSNEGQGFSQRKTWTSGGPMKANR